MQKVNGTLIYPTKLHLETLGVARNPFECIIHYKFPGYTVLKSMYSHKQMLKVHQ